METRRVDTVVLRWTPACAGVPDGFQPVNPLPSFWEGEAPAELADRSFRKLSRSFALPENYLPNADLAFSLRSRCLTTGQRPMPLIYSIGLFRDNFLLLSS